MPVIVLIAWEEERVKMSVTQLCPTLCDSMDYSLPASSVRGILQARILEWVTIPFLQEAPVQTLGWRDPLEKGMATHSSVLAWRIPWTEEHGGLQSMESQRVGHN